MLRTFARVRWDLRLCDRVRTGRKIESGEQGQRRGDMTTLVDEQVRSSMAVTA